MLTKNFYSFMGSALSGSSTSARFILVDGSGYTAPITTSDSPPFSAMNIWSYSVEKKGVSFGTGTTPATASDYVLESILDNTKINVSVPSAVSYSRGDTYDEYSVTFGVTNKTAEAITISEIGLTAMPYKGSSSSGTTNYALVDRTVLDAPITIPAGQSKQITYTIRFNYGDAV